MSLLHAIKKMNDVLFNKMPLLGCVQVTHLADLPTVKHVSEAVELYSSILMNSLERRDAIEIEELPEEQQAFIFFWKLLRP